MPSSAADPLIQREPMVKVLPFSVDKTATARNSHPIAGIGRTVGLAWRATFPRPKAIDAVREAILACQLAGVATAR